jgi:hypothetical protein
MLSSSVQTIADSFACQYFGCAKNFESLTSLCIHKRMVHGAQSWTCDVCDKNFKDEPSFTNHTKSHATEVQDPLFLPIEYAPAKEIYVKTEELHIE